jgi:hypothetical protein
MMMMLAVLISVPTETNKSAFYTSFFLHFHKVNIQIIVCMIFMAVLSSYTPILVLHPMLVPVNYTTVTSFNELSPFEIPPVISKAASSEKNISAPLVANPSYTVTNATMSFGTDVLTSNHTQNELNDFILKTLHALINATGE